MVKIRLSNSRRNAIYMIPPLTFFFLLLVLVALIIPSLSTIKTLALLFGIVIFFISFVSTEAALYILIFSMLLSPEFIVGATGGASLGRGITLRLDDLIIIIIGLSWLARMSINKELGLFLKTPLNKPVALYILLCLVSTLFGALFGRVDLKTGFFFVLKYFEYVIIYFMVVNHLKTEKQVIRYVWAILITCTIVSIIGISQIPMGYRVTAPFEGTSGEPNTLGGYLVFMISLAIGFLLTVPSLKGKLMFSGLALLFFIPLLYTQSRSSYAALVPAMICFLFLSDKKIIMLLSIIFAGLIFLFFTPEVAKNRINYTFTQGLARRDVVEIGGIKLDTSTSDRIRSWHTASKDWTKEPLLGYGVTGYRFVDAQYIRVLVETGILGLLAFLLLLGTIYRMAYKNLLNTNNAIKRGLVMGFLAGFTGLLFHALGANTFIIVRIMEPFWFVTGMVILINQTGGKEQAAIP